jgi:hypothetical protein
VLCAQKGSEGLGRLGYRKKKREEEKWAGWGIWPKWVLGLKDPLHFLVFESNLNLNQIQSSPI